MQTTKLDYSSNNVKIKHFMRQNDVLTQTVKKLQEQVAFHRKLNNEMLNASPNQQQNNLKELYLQNNLLQMELMRLIKSNQEYLCQILMKDQLICEINKQHDQIIANYQEKIQQLRTSILKKQEYVINIQKKYQDEKKTIVGVPTYKNVAHLGEINELRMYIDRLNIQNHQLKYLNGLKEQQIQNLKKKVDSYEMTFKKLNLLSLQDTNNTSSSIKVQKIASERINLESQISSYDANYQQIKSKSERLNFSSKNLRLIITHLNCRNLTMVEEKIRILQQTAKKEREYYVLLDAYKKSQQKINKDSIQIKFLKLSLKYFEDYVIIPRQNVQDNEQLYKYRQHDLKQKGLYTDYWKRYALAIGQSMLTDRRILSIKPFRLYRNVKRPKSCPSYFRHLKDSIKENKAQTIDIQGFSFALGLQNSSKIIAKNISKENNQSSNFFDEEISGIFRPKNNKFSSDYDGDLKEVYLQ